MRIAGVVYLFEASQLPTSSDNIRDRKIFQSLCGNDALSAVIVGMTKWENNDEAEENEKILKEAWEEASGRQCGLIYPVQNTYESAWGTINHLAQEQINCTVLQIQRELVELGKPVAETEAGKLVYALSKRRRRFSLPAFILRIFRIGI